MLATYLWLEYCQAWFSELSFSRISEYTKEFSIMDEGVLSEGFMSGKGLCLEGVMHEGGFV